MRAKGAEPALPTGQAGSASIGSVQRLKAGKLAPDKLRRVVLSHLSVRRPEVRVHAGLGEDAAVVDAGGRLVVVSSDPITGFSAGMGRLGVHVACNDLAAMGAEPLGVQVVLLMPEGTEDGEVAAVMREVATAAEGLGIEVLGGHTELTSKVTEPIVIFTALGLVEPQRLVTSAGARPGDELVITKAAGIEGTAILAWDRGEELQRVLGAELVERARRFLDEVSAVREGRLAAELGVSAMHDVTEGGLLGAVWELCQASGVEAEVWEASVPVREETRRICQHFGIDPLALISSGTMLMAVPNGAGLVQALGRQGVAASVIGRVMGRADGGSGSVVVVRPDGRRETLAQAPVDELWRVLLS